MQAANSGSGSSRPQLHLSTGGIIAAFARTVGTGASQRLWRSIHVPYAPSSVAKLLKSTPQIKALTCRFPRRQPMNSC